MKKKILLTLFLCLFIVSTVSPQSWVYSEDCIATAIAEITTGDEAVMVTDFVTIPIKVSRRGGGDLIGIVSITVTFTGDGTMDGNDVDFYFQASYDNGTTYTTTAFWVVGIESDTDHVANVVRYTDFIVPVWGISHLRLWKIVNNDATSSITDVNATISGGR